MTTYQSPSEYGPVDARVSIARHHNALLLRNIQAGARDAAGVWEVGDRVEVVYDNNAFGKYFPGVVHKVHEELPLSNKRHWFADYSAALYYIFCCHVSPQRAVTNCG